MTSYSKTWLAALVASAALFSAQAQSSATSLLSSSQCRFKKNTSIKPANGQTKSSRIQLSW